ncbi:hypothetical protein ACFY8O_14835 [Streptomyces argenteolus]|uniref:Ig-like domain-containing protein n=1 Tax=Streptomyces argenteolus TaxID=67274 RepID=A0ABW6X543_9ACTN
MNPARPSRISASAPSRPRLGRVAALAAGATLGIGALAGAPLASGSSGTDATGTVALVADTASPAVTLGVTAVKPGGEVAFEVTGFPAGATLSVKFDDKTLLGQFAIGDDGSVSGSVTVPADAAPGGEHWLRFLAPQTSVRSENLTVTGSTPTPTPTPTRTPTPQPTTEPPAAAEPAVRLTNSGVTAGGKVTFTLSGFTKGQSVTVKLDDADIIGQWPSAVKADGTLTATVTVPQSTSAGSHWLRFLAPNPSTSLRADISVTPSGTGGSGGSGTGGSGSGGSGSGGSDSGTGGSGSSGTGSGSGTTGGSSGSASGSTSATITAGSQVAAGGKVSFRVTGFPAGQQLTVKLDDSEIIGQWANGIGADGSMSGTVTVPAEATKGAHWLRFLAPNPSTSLRADFTVTSGAPAGQVATASGPTGRSGATSEVPAATGAPAAASNSRGSKATISASEVQPGGTIPFEVVKFPAGQTVTIKLDDEEILGQWKADASGAYKGEVTIPAETPPGAHWLRFLAPNPSTTLKVDFTVTAPGTPATAADPAAVTPDAVPGTVTAVSSESSVSYPTIAWSAAAAAVGGAAGAAATTLFVVRRRPGGTAAPAGPAGPVAQS